MFAKKLKEILQRMNMTQAELAAASGLTRASISQYISGKHMPSKKAITAIAEAVGMPEVYFTDDIEGIKAENIPTERRLPLKLTVQQAARLMNVCPQAIRINLQNGNLPFGYALQGTGNKYSYYISTRKFMKCEGFTEQEVLEVV